MAAVGDQIEVSSKAGPRSGVVIAAKDTMIVVRWTSGEETSFVPGPGVLSVVKRRGSRSVSTAGTSGVRARTGTASRASNSSKRENTSTSKRRAATKKPAKTKTRSLVKQTATPKHAAAKKAGTERTPSKTAKKVAQKVGRPAKQRATKRA